MGALVEKYLDKEKPLTVLDVGSYDVNGTYKPLFVGWVYTGVDIAAGPNVDIVLASPDILPFPKESFDVVISGSTFEHMPRFWLMWLEMVRVVRPGGYIFVIAPSRGYEHRHPVDCWRFYPDGYRALGEYGGVETLEAWTDWDGHDYESMIWGDTVGAFKKVG